jgi:hypothetical protein
MFGRPMGLPGMVILPHNWETGYTNPKSMPLAHEFGHVWDARTGNISLQGIVNGVADQLNTFIGGTVVEQNGSRFADGSGWSPEKTGYVPEDYKWDTGFNGNYGNNSTADYLCEVFNALIYKPQAIPKASEGDVVGNWVRNVIKQQADALTPPVTPQAVRAPYAPSSTPTPSQTPLPPPPSNTPSSSPTVEARSQTPEPR